MHRTARCPAMRSFETARRQVRFAGSACEQAQQATIGAAQAAQAMSETSAVASYLGYRRRAHAICSTKGSSQGMPSREEGRSVTSHILPTRSVMACEQRNSVDV